MDSYTEQKEIAPFHLLRVADDEDIGLYVRAKPTAAEDSYTVEVDAGGELTFKKGALGAEAVDSNVGASGVIDTNAAAYNTFGKLVNYLNSLSEYEAYLGDVLAADSSDDTLLITSATQIKTTAGVGICKDTSAALNLSIAVSGEDFNYREDGCLNECNYIASVNTFGSGTNLIQIYEGATKKTQWSGGATGVEQEKTNTSVNFGVTGKKLLIRMIGSAACTGSIRVQKRTARLVPTSKFSKD